MSDLLSGLPTLTAPVSIKDERGDHHAVTNAIKWVKVDDVRETLRNPTDEQRALMGKALWDAGPRRPGEPEWENLDLGLRRVYEKEACAVLAAAAGGDQ